MLILSITHLNNYLCIRCYFSVYAFYKKFLIILLFDILLCIWNNPCALIYLLDAAYTCTSTCSSVYIYKIGCKTWQQANCYIAIHVVHVHVQGNRCMTNSNNYFIVSISFVLHTSKININIIILHSYIYDVLLHIYRIADVVFYPINKMHRYLFSYETLDHHSNSHSKQTDDYG